MDATAPEYTRMNGLEYAYQYIYENQIPLDQVNANDPVFQNFFKMDSDKYSFSHMTEIFQQMVTATMNREYLPTNVLIPKGKRIYIRKWPCYMPGTNFYHLDAIEIHYVLQGTVTHTVSGDSFDMQEGDMCFIAPDTYYHLQINDGNTVMLSIIAYVDILRDILKDQEAEGDILSGFFSDILYGKSFLPFLFCDTRKDSLIRSLIPDMMDTQDSETAYADRYMRSCMELLCLRLLRHHKSHIISGNSTIRDGVRITAIIDYAQAHFRTITLHELARKYGYSYSYLSTIIKEHYGHSFHEIMTEIKLSKAASYLINTELSIPEIAESSGYTDKSHFHKMFKRKYHMTPEQYRITRP